MGHSFLRPGARLALASALSAATIITPAGVDLPVLGAPLVAPPGPPVTSRADIDGDGRPDTTTLSQVPTSRGHHRYVLRITTSGGVSTRIPMTIPFEIDPLPPKSLWVGAAHLDGVRGAELVLDVSPGVGDTPEELVYTWRKGRLVGAPAPNGLAWGKGSARNEWRIANTLWAISGYTFATKGGVRQVTHHDLKGRMVGEKPVYAGRHTTYRWSAGTWRRVSSRPVRGLSEKAAVPFADWHGLRWS